MGNGEGEMADDKCRMADDRCEVRSGGCAEGAQRVNAPEVLGPSPWCVDASAPGTRRANATGVPGAAKGAKRSPTGINAKFVVAWI